MIVGVIESLLEVLSLSYFRRFIRSSRVLLGVKYVCYKYGCNLFFRVIRINKIQFYILHFLPVSDELIEHTLFRVYHFKIINSISEVRE